MRARNIKPGILRNEFFGTADPLLTILFEGLWMIADREGRLEDRPMLIKADVFPYREGIDVNGGLTVIEREGFIQRYEVNGKRYIQIKNFLEHQKPHSTEKQSLIPPPPVVTEEAKKIKEQKQDVIVINKNNSEPTVNPPLDNAPDSLIHRFTDSSDSPSNEGSARATPKAKKISLNELTVDHIADWLARKRSEGRYLQHDEYFILDYFKNYCTSKGKKYDDYTAAYRNAFEWDSCQPKERRGGDPATNAHNAAQSIIARRNAAAGIGRGAKPANPSAPANLCLPENLC